MEYEGIEIGQGHGDDNHTQQSSHTHGMRAYLGKDINKKCNKQAYDRPQHERSESARNIGVIEEIVEKPKVEDTRNDVWANPFLCRFHFHSLYKPQELQHYYGNCRNKEGR